MTDGASLANLPQPPRTLTLFDSLGIGINGIVGSGVYLLVAPLAAVGGSGSVFGVLLCGALCVLIALNFAELSSMFDQSGGPYLYARLAFGKFAGFCVGWLGMATGILGLSAVSLGFAGALARFVPALSGARGAAAVGFICLLGAINYRGVRLGGSTSTFLSVVKIVPLVVLAAVGLCSARTAAPLPAPPGGVIKSAFLAIFMMSGFEYAAVPAGEVKDAKRNIPLAIVGSIALASLLYAALQWVSLGSLEDLGSRQSPLADLGLQLFGPVLGSFGGTLIGLTAVTSMAGFCAGVALVAPRYFTALAKDGYLPARLCGLSRHQTPGAAILAATALASLLAVVLEYASLVNVANVVILSGYALTALSALVLRLRRPDLPRRYTLPLGPLLPLLAAAGAVALLVSARPQLAEWRFTFLLLLLGLAAWAATAAAAARRV